DVRRAREQLLEIGTRKTRYGGHARTRGRMVGPRGTSVKAALVLAMLAGCFWRTYGRLAATHVDVLVGMARKGVDLVANGRFTAESMPELTYPLERAQAFAETARARAAGRPPGSLLAFEALLVRYRRFLDPLARVRPQPSAA